MLSKHSTQGNRFTYIYIFLLLILVTIPVRADILYNLAEDSREIFNARTLLPMGIGASFTGASLLLEDSIGYEGFMGNGILYNASVVSDNTFGLPLLGASALVWGIGALNEDWDNAEITGQLLTEGLLVTYAITGLLKLGVGRERPDGSNTMSFPSGHTSGTSCCAVILWDRYGAGAGIPATLIAVFTGLSRITLGKHYPSDIFAGATVGVITGLAVINAHEPSTDTPNPQPTFMIYYNFGEGLSLEF